MLSTVSRELVDEMRDPAYGQGMTSQGQGPKYIAVQLPGNVTADVCERQTDGSYVGVASCRAGLPAALNMAAALNDREDLRAVTTHD